MKKVSDKTYAMFDSICFSQKAFDSNAFQLKLNSFKKNYKNISFLSIFQELQRDGMKLN